MLGSFRILPVCWAALLAVQLRSEDLPPDFRKLAPVPLFPALVEAAHSNNIPLDGIAPASEADVLSPGDSLTGLITLFEKGGHRTQWLLCVEVATPTAEENARKPRTPLVLYVGAGDKEEFQSCPVPVNLRLLGPFPDGTAKGKPPKVEDQRAHIRLDKGFLGIGIDQAAAATYRIRQNKLHGRFVFRSKPFTDAEAAEGLTNTALLHLSAQEQRAIPGSQLALMSYAHLVQETPGLDELFYKVAKAPSLWSLVRHLGVSVSLQLEREYVAPTDTSNWHLPPRTPCYTFPLVLRVNGQPALTATLVVVPPLPPLLGCGGVVGLLAERPNDKETYLLLRIVSAHHRPAP